MATNYKWQEFATDPLLRWFMSHYEPPATTVRIEPKFITASLKKQKGEKQQYGNTK